jgi:2-hydroxy-4-carboxymuconate semialdehyde hemiacetal dehydrogenase
MAMTRGGDRRGVAIVGSGAIADLHAAALRVLDAPIRVVAGRTAEGADAFAARHAIPRATIDVRAAIEDPDVDAVVIASPSPVHAEQARLALDAGRHALVEIPLALSLADGAALVDRAERAGLVLAVCHTLRYWEPFDVARGTLAERGLIPRHVVARGLSRRRENVGWTGRRRTWTDNLLWHHGGHVVDAVLELLGAPVEAVRASVGPVWEGSGLPMDYAITLQAADGALASIALSYNARIGASDYLVIADEDTLSIAGAEVRLADGPVYDGGDPAVIQDRAILNQDGDFLAAIAGGTPPRASAAAILPSLRVLHAVEDVARAALDAPAGV